MLEKIGSRSSSFVGAPAARHGICAGCALIVAICLLDSHLSAGAALPAVPPELVPQVAEARKQMDRGDFAGAEAAYRKMSEAAPDNGYFQQNLGIVLFRERKFKAAEEAFAKAIALDPADEFSHCTLGIVHYYQARYDEALSALDKALAMNPQDATAHNYRGLILSNQGQSAEALKELETAVSLAPDYADAHYNLAVVYGTMVPPDKENGRKLYGRALKLGADHDLALEPLIDWSGRDAAKPVAPAPK